MPRSALLACEQRFERAPPERPHPLTRSRLLPRLGLSLRERRGRLLALGDCAGAAAAPWLGRCQNHNIAAQGHIMTGFRLAAALAASVALGALAAPAFADEKVFSHTSYYGVLNDLLTAGLGKTGLGSPVPPGFVNALQPTAEELRRLAIYNNYRAL